LVTIASGAFSRTSVTYISINGQITGITRDSLSAITSVSALHIRGPVGDTLCAVIKAVWPTANSVYVSNWSEVPNGGMICGAYPATVEDYTQHPTRSPLQTGGTLTAHQSLTTAPTRTAEFTRYRQPYRIPRGFMAILHFMLLYPLG
jgi:hypothetical protein